MLKQQMRKDLKNETCPAAFGRLCVETLGKSSRLSKPSQPPSGGCVLKLDGLVVGIQPPSGGCVLKHQLILTILAALIQPPSGGCVLKHLKRCVHNIRP